MKGREGGLGGRFFVFLEKKRSLTKSRRARNREM